MGRAEANREMKFLKWCSYESGKGGSWLRSRVKWLRKDDIIKMCEGIDEEERKIKYKVCSSPYWSKSDECWDVKLIVWEK